MAAKVNAAEAVTQTVNHAAGISGTATLILVGIALVITFLTISWLWEKGYLKDLKNVLGARGLPTPAFTLAVGLWLLLFVLLVIGIIVAILNVALREPPADKDALWEWRFMLAAITAMTATLGGVVALPITLYRLRLRRQQAVTADEALFNDKIKAAADDLHARRQVTKIDKNGKPYDAWEDDVVRRNAAIDRLEGLARERPEIAPRIARLLSTYVRELSRECPPQQPPEEASLEELRKWAQSLKPCRSDMENAAQVLSRLQQIDGVDVDAVRIDLRSANLQGFELSKGSFRNARLLGVCLQGADLNGVDMQEADLRGAKLHGGDLSEAKLQKANLLGAKLQESILWKTQLQKANLFMAELRAANLLGVQLQGADLSVAQLQGVDLSKAQLQGAFFIKTQLQGANLSGAILQGAIFSETQLQGTIFRNAKTTGTALKNVNCLRVINLTQKQLNEMFGDGSVKLPINLQRPDFWPEEKLNWREFKKRWSAWQIDRGCYKED